MNLLRGQVGNLVGALLGNRRIVRAPIWIYRARLGAVFGRRLLMLQHRGRKTGAKRYVVLEVIDHPAPDQYVVASGFGLRAQWLRNVQRDPRVGVFIGSRRPAAATAVLLDREEATSVLRRYAAEHPHAWRHLEPVFERLLGSAITEDGTDLPLVRLSLQRNRG